MRLVVAFSVLAVAIVLATLETAGGCKKKAEPSTTPAVDVTPLPPPPVAADATTPSDPGTPGPIEPPPPAGDAATPSDPGTPGPTEPPPPAADASVPPQAAADTATPPPAAADAQATPPPPPADAGRRPRRAKPTPHGVEGMENCIACHKVGEGASPMPGDHGGYANETCLTCHPTGAP